MRPLRILHVVANRWWTGSADPALDLAAGLRARGHTVTFACIRGDALEARARAIGLPPVDGLSLERTAQPGVLWADICGLRRLCRTHGIELVHAHQSHDHWLATLAVSGQGVRLVRTLHHRRAVHRGIAGRWLLGRTGAVVAVSQGIARAARTAGVPEARITVVPGAVDPARFSPEARGRAFREELGLGTAPVVGSVARLVPGRGHDVLLRAVALLRPRVPGLRLVLVGRGEGRPAIERLVGELALERVVVFAGYRGADLPEALAALDCFVLLGAGSEESCRSVLEAMAAGRPVVAAPVGAVPETLVEGESGWLTAAEPESVASRVEAVLSDPGRGRAMGQAGRRRVEALFTPARRVADIEAIYTRLIAPAALPYLGAS